MSAKPSEAGGLLICRPSPLAWDGDQIGLTLLSDLHLGARICDEKAIKRDLDTALSNGDRININGDIFDGILPTDQKRYVPSTLAEWLWGHDDFLNAMMDFADELFTPYAHLIDVIGVGNHDVSLVKHDSFDPVLNLVKRLNKHLEYHKIDHQIQYGGYCGFIDYRIKSSKSHYRTFYHHGWGGGNSLTSSMSDYNKLCSFVEGADLCWLGHRHTRLNSHHQKLCCPTTGSEPTIKEVRFVRTGAYLKAHQGQTQHHISKHGRRGNYASDAAFAPQGQGGARVLLTKSGKNFETKILQ